MDAGELKLIMSPYHLTTREAPAMAALLLGSTVTTLMPRPHGGTDREEVARAVERAPRYWRLMESWRWSGELWRSGVIRDSEAGQPVVADVPGVYETIDDTEAFAPLRGLVARTYPDHDAHLDAVSGDIIRGGPDPGIMIPLCAAVDRFAARHGMVVVRAGASSVAQRAESRLARKVFAVALPVALLASAKRIAAIRHAIGGELKAVRTAIACCAAAVISGDIEVERVAAAELAKAIACYTAAFNRLGPELLQGDDDEGSRVSTGYVSVTGVVMPAEAVLISSRVAMRAMHGVVSGGVGPTPIVPTHGLTDAPLTGRPGGQGARVFSILIKEMNASPASG